MEYMKAELKKYLPLCVMLFLVGIVHSVGLGLCLVGLFLLIEHMYSYGRWDVKDILGHETFGIVLFLLGFIILQKYYLGGISLALYLVFGKWVWEPKLSPIKYALKKVDYNGKK